MRGCKNYIYMFVLIVAIIICAKMPGVSVQALEQTIEAKPMSSSESIDKAKKYSYSYTQENKVSIDGKDYYGIVIPIKYSYAGGVLVNVVGDEYISTTAGTVYCGLFDSETYNKDAFEEAGRTYDLRKSVSKAGTMYLVYYTDISGANISSFKTNFDIQIALRYENTYDVKADTTYKCYSKSSSDKNSVKFNITKPGYYEFAFDKTVVLFMDYADKETLGHLIPAYNTEIGSGTNYKGVFYLMQAGNYSMSITSKTGTEYSFSYKFSAAKDDKSYFTLTKDHEVSLNLADNTQTGLLYYKAEESGVLTIAGISKYEMYGTVSISDSTGHSMCSSKDLLTAKTVSDEIKLSIPVKKGEEYKFLIYAASPLNYLDATFQIVDFQSINIQQLGEETKQAAKDNNATLDFGKTYYGTLDWSNKRTTYIYIDKPCILVFNNKKAKSGDGYEIKYFDMNRAIFESYVWDDETQTNSGITTTIKEYAPGFLEIYNAAGMGYYEIKLIELSSSSKDDGQGSGQDDKKDESSKVEDVIKNPDGEVKEAKTANGITYKVTNTSKKFVSLKSAKGVKSSTIVIPDKIEINGKTYSVTKIEANAFKANKYVKKLTIGKNVSTIGKNAFSGCKNLKSVIIKSTKFTSKNVGAKAFSDINKKATIKVPKKKLKAYKKLLKSKGIKYKTQKITK